MENFHKNKTRYFILFLIFFMLSFVLPIILNMMDPEFETEVFPYLSIIGVNSTSFVILFLKIICSATAISILLYASINWPTKYVAPFAATMILFNISFIVLNGGHQAYNNINDQNSIYFHGLYFNNQQISAYLWINILITVPILVTLFIRIIFKLRNQIIRFIGSLIAVSILFLAPDFILLKLSGYNDKMNFYPWVYGLEYLLIAIGFCLISFLLRKNKAAYKDSSESIKEQKG